MQRSISLCQFSLITTLSSPSSWKRTPEDSGAARKWEGKQGWKRASGSWAAVSAAKLGAAGSSKVLGNTGDSGRAQLIPVEVHREAFQLQQS